MLSRNKNNSARCAVVLALSLLLPATSSSLAAKSLVSSATAMEAASEHRTAHEISTAPINTAAVGPAEPAVPVLQAPEPPSSLVSAIGFLYLCVGLALFKRRQQPSRVNHERNGAARFHS
jgi:hypothetical protein